MKLYKYIILAWAALHLFASAAWAQSEADVKVQPEAAVVDTLSPRQAKDWQRIFFSRPALFFDRALMGEETGFYSSYGGFVGNSGNLMIQGLNTVNLNASPFMVISGMPVKQTRSINPFVGGLVQNNWGFVNPLDVRTIKIVKGGYDASFYGGKAGNGLVELDFDRGAMGSSSIDFLVRVGFSQANYDFDVMDGEQFRSYLYAMMEDRGISPTELQQMGIFDNTNPQYSHHTDWLDVFVRNGLYQDYGLKMKGGDGDTRYLFSLSYASQDETLEESDYQRINMRFNLDYRISPKIEISNSLSYNYTTLHFNEEGDYTFRVRAIASYNNREGDWSEDSDTLYIDEDEVGRYGGSGRWMQDARGWWYAYDTGGYPANGWMQINGAWYLFDSSGYMLTGWQWKDSAWYYLNPSGVMLTGWQFINNAWYYLNPSGVMLTGWQYINGAWYYMNASGVMLTGWQQLGGQWYYLGANGAMYANTWTPDGYFVNASGVWVQ